MDTGVRVMIDGVWQPKVDSDAFDAALYAGLIAPTAREFPLTPDCAAANCTWNPYWTLVVESECSNLTDRLDWSNSTGLWSLPNGLEENSAFPYVLTTNYPSVAFQDRGQLLLDFFITVSSTRWNGHTTVPTASAMECILQLRAREVRADSTSGAWNETEIGFSLSNNTLEGRGCSPWRRLLASGEAAKANVTDHTGETLPSSQDEDPMSAQWFSGGPPNDANSTCNVTISTGSIGSAVSLVFPAWPLLTPSERLIYLLGSAENVWNSRSTQRGGITTYLVNVLSGDPMAQAALDKTSQITFVERVDNIAKSLTQALRSSYFQNSVVVAGDAHRDTVVYAVSWYWIIVPASLVLLTLLLLVLTAWDTFRKGLEKRADSSLALILFGCDQEVRESVRAAGDLAAMTKAAKRHHVRLGTDHVLTSTSYVETKG